MKNINQIDFADAQLKRINIEYDKAEIYIQLDDGKNSNLEIICSGLLGIDNLCIWDDTYIDNLSVIDADRNSQYLKEVFNAYLHSTPDRDLNKQIYDLKITLVNNITCHVYFQHYEIV